MKKNLQRLSGICDTYGINLEKETNIDRMKWAGELERGGFRIPLASYLDKMKKDPMEVMVELPRD